MNSYLLQMHSSICGDEKKTDYNDAASLEGLRCGLGWMEIGDWLNNMGKVSNMFSWNN